MTCNICGSETFRRVEYRNTGTTVGERSAPAFECEECGAISLDESAARTHDERVSVKIAIRSRRSLHDGGEIEESDPDAATARSEKRSVRKAE